MIRLMARGSGPFSQDRPARRILDKRQHFAKSFAG
jgi:hypothetical protein